MLRTTPIVGRGAFLYALVEGAAAALPARPSPGVIERAWHVQQLAAVFEPVPSAPPFQPGLAAQRALTERGRAHADHLAEQLASGLAYDAFYELLAIDAPRALASLDEQESLPAAFALLRRHREPGQLAGYLRRLGLLGEAHADIPRLATSTELLIAHGRAVSLWLRRELGDHALLAHALSELAHAAGLTEIYFEEQRLDRAVESYRVRAFCRGRTWELVYQHDTKWIDPEVVSGFVNAIARDLGIDLVVVAISELGTVFTWGTCETMLRAAQAGVFGWNGEVEWRPYVAFRFAGELLAAELARVARILGMEEAALIAALEGAACAGARTHPEVPREIELTATYEPARATIVLHAIAEVADAVTAPQHISLVVARTLDEAARIGDELPIELPDAAGRWFSFSPEPVSEAAEDAVNAWLADRFLPREISSALEGERAG